jgi:hypothetical protein
MSFFSNKDSAMSNNKLQALLINHLQKHGSVKLILPDGVTLEIGVNQLAGDGKLVKVDNYCWVMASREDRMAILDSYNCGVRYSADKTTVFEDEFVTSEGERVRRLDVV